MTGGALSYAIWACYGAAAVGLWVASLVRPTVVVRPSVVVQRLVTMRVVRVLLLVGFLFLGWHLFAR